MLTDVEYQIWLDNCETNANIDIKKIEQLINDFIEKYEVCSYLFNYDSTRERCPVITSLFWEPETIQKVIDSNIKSNKA